MTTDQTIDGVPRGLLENFASYAEGSASSEVRLWVKKLRALLDSPVYPQVKRVKPHKHTCACVTGDSGVCDCGAVVNGLPVPAAQPQGEPVAWMYKRKNQSEFGKPSQHIAFATPDLEECRTGNNVEGRVVFTTHDGYFDWKPLYAEQPAPVAVVLPERLAQNTFHPDGWNACLDEVTRLNSQRPTHANPPPGTEPSGTHHDNDGLDEWRKPDPIGVSQ